MTALSADPSPGPPAELRLVLTVADVPAARRLLAGALGLAVVEAWDDPEGRGVLLDAGRATVELVDAAQAERFDAVEAPGHRAGAVRLAWRVGDVEAAAARLSAHGAAPLAPAVETPWGHRQQRFPGPDGLHLTLFRPSPDPSLEPEVIP